MKPACLRILNTKNGWQTYPFSLYGLRSLALMVALLIPYLYEQWAKKVSNQSPYSASQEDFTLIDPGIFIDYSIGRINSDCLKEGAYTTQYRASYYKRIPNAPEDHEASLQYREYNSKSRIRLLVLS